MPNLVTESKRKHKRKGKNTAKNFNFLDNVLFHVSRHLELKLKLVKIETICDFSMNVQLLKVIELVNPRKFKYKTREK